MADPKNSSELVLFNQYGSGPDRVWTAWADPDYFTQWWCAPESKVSDVVMDVRPRGCFQQTQASPDSEIVVPFAGFYLEVAAPERPVLAFGASSPDGVAGMVLTVRLRAIDGGTEQAFHHTGAEDDRELRTDAELFFKRLAEFLAR